jgi:hypothetical protein
MSLLMKTKGNKKIHKKIEQFQIRTKKTSLTKIPLSH